MTVDRCIGLSRSPFHQNSMAYNRGNIVGFRTVFPHSLQAIGYWKASNIGAVCYNIEKLIEQQEHNSIKSILGKIPDRRSLWSAFCTYFMALYTYYMALITHLCLMHLLMALFTYLYLMHLLMALFTYLW